MSEQSGGPGWWQASDGKWYPPEQAPTAAQPTAAQPPVDPTAPYAAPAYATPAAAAGGGGGAGKVIAIVVVLALLAGGGAYLLTKGDGGGGSTASFCDTAKSLANEPNIDNAFDDPAQLDRVAASFDRLEKAAPAEIKNDVKTLNDAIKKILGAVKSAGNDKSKQFSEMLGVLGTLDQGKLDQATKNIEKFGKEKCGADFSFSNSDSSSSDSDSSSFTFDSSEFSSSLSEFSTSFDSDSLASELSSFCSEFGSEFCSPGG